MRNFLLLAALWLCALALLLCGCAIVPHGPVVSHTISRYADRQDGLVWREQWQDTDFTRGFYLFTDPSVLSLSASHTNQTALGGSSRITAGSFTIVVDSNIVPAITAGGTAVGNIVGAAVKSAVK